MHIDLLKDIVSSIAGKGAVGIVDLLHDKKNVNEFLIAKKLNMTINQTRNILYRLADEGLVSFIRKKDSKKGGWYTYFWTLNSGKSLVKFRDKIAKDVENLKSNIMTKKSKPFFYCPNCHIEYDEENALLHEYICPECGEVLQAKDNSTELEVMGKEVARLEVILSKLGEEIEIIHVKEDKSRERKHKAEARKKAKEKLEKKKARSSAKKASKATPKKEGKKKKPSKKNS